MAVKHPLTRVLRRINLVLLRLPRLAIVGTILIMLIASFDSGTTFPMANPHLGIPWSPSGPSLLSSGGSIYSGTGAARPIVLSGTALNDSIGTMYLDSFTSGHAVIDLPAGWMGQDISADIDHLSVTWDNLLQNGLLNDYHIENWLGLGYNDEPVYVPNGWTLTISEEGGESGRNPHAEHGIWEFDENPGLGYDDSVGFNFESIWNSGNFLTSDDEVYLSQLVEVPAREVYSAQVSFLYNVMSASDLNDQTYLFVRFADHEERLHVVEPGDSTTTWLPAAVNIPASTLQNISYPNALCLDIGLGTDLSGTQTVGRRSEIYIDEIELSLTVRPFPEQVGLKANGTIVSGLTLGSASPFVPDDEYIAGVSSRDCRSWPGVGVHLDGRTGDGIQEVGVYDASGWSGAQAFQIAFQFPLSIPMGAAITSARLEIEGATGATANRAGMRVFVADHDNMTPFTPGFPVLRDRYEWVDTSVDWYPTGSWDADTKYFAPEFSPLVQSVISRPGWSSGNYLCVMLDYAGSTGYADWNNAKGSSDYPQDDLARLYIDFFIPESEDTVSSFMYTKDITIDHTKVSADLTDFPMLVDIYDTDLRADVQPDGDDIAFVIDGKALSHEIELFDQTYNSTHAHLIAWVRVPTLSGSSDTIITMCYGNPLLHSSEDPSSVWDDNYSAVWHLRETPLDDPKFLDSTLNANDGTAFGSMTQSDQVAAQIDGGIDFDGNDDYLLVPDSDSLDITGQLTIEAWAYYGGKASNLQNYAKILCKSLSTVDDPWHVYALGLDNSAAGNQVIQFEISNGTLGSHVKVESVTIMPTNTWMHIVGVYDGSEMHIYVNGFDENQLSTSVAIGELDLPLHIGNWITSTDNRWNGIIDEIRLSRVARSADWILTEFNNQDEPASFFSVGPEESLSLSEKVKLVFNVESSPVVSLGLTMRVNASTTVDTLDINLEPGTSFSVSNGSDTVLWTANIPLTLPSGFQDVGFEMSYPVRDWKPISLTSALGIEKQINSQWTYDAGTVTVKRDAVDAYGIWKLEFASTNHLSDLRMGPSGGPFNTTGQFDVDQEAEFRGWVPWIADATSEMTLYDPDGSAWYTDTNTTSGSSTHEIPSFRYKKDITIDHNEVNGDLIGFPVLLDISDLDLHDSNKIQSDGDDILFVSNGVVLAHEVQVFDQNYNTTHAHLIAWVKANLSSTVDTVISMYYGNPVVGSQQRPNEVWRTGYVGVWHLEETPTDAVGEMRDSTVERNDGYTVGSMNSSDSINAVIGSGLELDGIDDMVIVPESSALSAVNDLGTLQVWINWADASDGDYQRVMCTRNRFKTGVPYDGFEWGVQSDGDHFFYPWGGNGSNYNLATNPFTDGTWQHLVVTLDYYTKEVKIYLDGALLTLAIENVPTLWTQLAHLDDWLWGGNAAPFVNKPLTGMLDEIRVSDVVRSPEWIATEYGNQNDPVSFCIVGGESERPYAQPSFKKVLDSSAPAGQWTVSICHNDTASTADHIVGVYERSFILKHSSLLNLLSPGDAVSDGLAVRVAGDLLLIEVELLDSSDSSPIEDASVTVNWTGSEELEDYGGGVYGKALNTSILGATGRWRINIYSYHQHYSNTSMFFDLDLSHRTRIEYKTPQMTPYGDDFEVLITLFDDFDDTPLDGATITSNGTIVGVPTDYNNGSYLVTIDSVGLSFGEHTFMLNATPSQPYMIESSVVVSFTYREIETDLTTTGTDPANVPWGQTVNTTLQWVDLDHGMSGIPSGALSGDSGFVWNDIGSGLYTVQIDVTSYEPGVYLLNFTLARINYESGWVTVAVNIVPHRTYITAAFNGSVPYGADTYVEVTFHDLDLGGSPVPGNFSQVVAQWAGGSSNHATLQFWLSTDTWNVGAHIVNLTAEASNSPRYYYDARSSIQINIHKLTVSITWDHIDTFPIGDDFEIILHILVDDPGSSYDDNPVNGLTISDFSAEDKHGTPYTIKALTPLGGGNYNLTIDQSNFPGGNYTIKIYLDFNPTENYYDTETPMMAFTYRAARSYLSSPDYPQVTIPYDTNVTITLDFEDIDRGQGIETATIMVEGATILSQQHVGGGEYEVLLETSGWSKGFYNINLTASAAGYDNQTISIDIVVRTIHTYAIPTVGALDIPVGDSRVFYVDYVDIDHDTAVYPATGTCNWSIAPYSVEWADTRFKVTIQTLDSNVLGDYLLLFNFSKDTNYDVGLFNISVTIRTIDTTFRLVDPVESTTPAGYFYISVYYGDLDHNQGIMSSLVECTVRNATGLVVRLWNNNTVLGPGYYNITISASQFGGLGTQMLTVYFNWTGPVQKYENLAISVSAEIVGRDSTMTLVEAAQPSACLENMSYTIQYADLSSGAGITNETGNVLIHIEFVGLSIDLSQVDIWETDRGTQPGYYSIRFNTTLLGTIGLFSMKVFINWSRYASPYYTNRTDTISVRVLPRDTLLSVIPPMSTPFGENATFSFTFEDVTGGISQLIDYDSDSMTVALNLSDFSLSYDSIAKLYTISFNTSQFGFPLGERAFVLNVIWTGIPFFANRTGRLISVVVTARQTSFTYPTPASTPYGDNTTFTVTFTDVTGDTPQGLDGCSATLYNNTAIIPLAYYTVIGLGDGVYEIEIDTSYFNCPGQYDLKIEMSTGLFYISDVSITRKMTVTYRITILTADPQVEAPYNSSLEIVLHYQDLSTLIPVANETGSPTTVEILNVTGWIYTCIWRASLGSYLLTVETYNQGLDVNTPYVLWVNFSAPNQAPFHMSADMHIPFQLVDRPSGLALDTVPPLTSYLDDVDFTVLYQDLESATGIENADIEIYYNLVQLQESTDYLLTPNAGGYYSISVHTVILGVPGVKILQVIANWTLGSPYHSAAVLNVSVTVTGRLTNVEILIPPSQTQFLDNVTTEFAFVDLGTGQQIAISENDISIYGNHVLLSSDEYTLNRQGSSFLLSINSTEISPILVSNWNLTIVVDWNATAPYYFSDQTTIWITTTNRVGIVSLGQVLSTPMGDNLTLTIAFADGSTGQGIDSAIVALDCLEVPGLTENVDYWILEGSGVSAGNYTVLVSSTSLGTIGQFTFSLEMNWNPLQQPYYRNVTNLEMRGTIRLVQSSIANDIPTPSLVPFHQNISFLVNFTDLDHAFQIDGAETDISIAYKSSGAEPSIWSIQPLSGGMYNITVNVTDLVTPGLQALVVSIDYYPYLPVQIEVTFQVRLRIGVISAEVGPTNYAGYSTFVIVNLTDLDAIDAPLLGAALTLEWDDDAYYVELGNGLYNVTLDTSNLGHGTQNLNVSATLPYYQIQSLKLSINLLSVPSELIVTWTGPRHSTPYEVFWGESFTIYAAFNDTLRNQLIHSALVTYNWTAGVGNLTSSGIPGNYTVSLDTGQVESGATVTIYIQATGLNYHDASMQIIFHLLLRPIDVTPEDYKFAFSINKGSPIDLILFVEDSLTGDKVANATVTVSWALGMNLSLSPVAGMPGYYQILLSTDSLNITTYKIDVVAYKPNHLEASTTLSVSVAQIRSEIWLDDTTAAYEYSIIIWSQVVRIGVYVLTPALNESDPYSTGLPACTVWWSSPELGLNGTMLNGSLIGGPGYFYLDFNSTNYDATTYTFRLSATPLSIDYTDSATTVTLLLRNLPTTVVSPGSQNLIWGWTSLLNFTFNDTFHDLGIANAVASYYWAGGSGVLSYLGDGVYAIPINASSVHPGVYPLTVSFEKLNHDNVQTSLTIRVDPVPTALSILVPYVHRDDGSATTLRVPYNDLLDVAVFYNNTATGFGIHGANVDSALFSGPGFFESPFELVDAGSGNYTFEFDTRLWELGSQFTFYVTLSLENRTTRVITFEITIIETPTSVVLEGDPLISLFYGENLTIWVYYRDEWELHGRLGIPDGAIHVSYDGTQYVSIEVGGADPTRPGYYSLTIFALRQTGSTGITIKLNKTYYESKTVQLTVSVSPSEADIQMQNMITYGSVSVLVILLAAVIWVRILKVPKIIRKLKSLLRQIRRGKVPKPDPSIKGRGQLISEIFNEMLAPIGVERHEGPMLAHSIEVEVPEIEELLVEVSLLTGMTREEIDEFKSDISKMKLSDQTTFTREIKKQEAARFARLRGVSVEEIVAEVEAERERILSGLAPTVIYNQELVAPPPGYPAEEVEEEKVPKAEDRLSEQELEELKRELEKRGLPLNEIEAMISQARQLPKEIGMMMLKSMEKFVEPADVTESEDRLSEKELDELRAELTRKKVKLREIESIVAQASELPRHLVDELAATIKEEPKAKKPRKAKPKAKKPPKTEELLTEEELKALGEELMMKGVSPEEVKSIVDQARAVPRKSADAFIQKVKRADALTPAETVEFEDRLSDFDIQDLRLELQKRGLPAPEIESIVAQAKNLPKSLIADLLDSIEPKDKD